jgi:hypothetical protein
MCQVFCVNDSPNLNPIQISVLLNVSSPALQRTQGMHKGAAALLWGELAHDACQRLLLANAAWLPAWGEPARPGFPP